MRAGSARIGCSICWIIEMASMVCARRLGLEGVVGGGYCWVEGGGGF